MRIFLIITSLFLLLMGEGHPAALSDGLKKFWEDPSIYQVNSQIIRARNYGPIRMEEVFYSSRPYKGKTVQIFGYFSYPRIARQKLPAILIVHGGGGTAKRKRTIAWAKRGYAVMAIDLPGKGEKRISSRSGGPDMDVPILLRTKPDLTYNYLIHAVAAARCGITYLSRRKEVDPERIGMVGLSWGGVITLLTNGQDSRLKAAVDIFGSGYIPEGCTWEKRFASMGKGELDAWNNYLDPKNFLKTQSAPIFFITGTNDHCFYLPTFQKSYDNVSASKSLCILPNLKHRFLTDTQKIAWTWLDRQLKGKGNFSAIELKTAFMDRNKIILAVSASPESAINSVKLYYAIGQPNKWTIKKWKPLNSYRAYALHYFDLPLSLFEPEILFYVTAKEAGGLATSTPICSILKARTTDDKTIYAVSSAIKHIYSHDRPFIVLSENASPEICGQICLRYNKQNNSYSAIYPPLITELPAQIFPLAEKR